MDAEECLEDEDCKPILECDAEYKSYLAGKFDSLKVCGTKIGTVISVTFKWWYWVLRKSLISD